MLATLLLLQTLTHTPRSVAADEQSAEIELQQIVEQLNDLDSWLVEATDKRARLEREIRDKDKEVAKVAAEVRQAKQNLKQAKLDLTELGYRRDLLTEQRQVQAQRIGEHLAAAYRLTGKDVVKQLLNQESPDELERMLRYHEVLSGARIEALQQFEQTVQRLEQNRLELEAQTQALTQKQKRLNQRQQGLVNERDTRKGLITTLNGEVEDQASKRKRLLANRSRLESLLTELRQRAPQLDGKEFANNKGSLPWPISGDVASKFGSTKDDGQMKLQGVLFGAAEGEPVRAVYSGKVVFADWLRGYGLLIILDHGGGYMTLYGNADGLLKNLDDWVEGGELIAQAGRSGGQVDSGLYFEIRHKGQVSNPLGWLVKP